MKSNGRKKLEKKIKHRKLKEETGWEDDNE